MNRPVRLTRRGYILAFLAILVAVYGLSVLLSFNRGLVPCDSITYDTPSTFPAGSAGARAFLADEGQGVIVCR